MEKKKMYKMCHKRYFGIYFVVGSADFVACGKRWSVNAEVDGVFLYSMFMF